MANGIPKLAFTYEQKTGRFLGIDDKVMATGYSGHGAGINNPEMQNVRATGPIPRGDWHIGVAYKSASLGPVVMNLEPVGHGALGRTLFRIHGDNSKGDRSASHGCIILPRAVRERVAASGIARLTVVEG